ncbi:MAG: secretin N-terminal domain-containing protein [Steroidobacteraceae bacterium]
MPLVSEKDKRPDGEYVTMIIRVRSLSAAQLVPILRPLLPPQATFSAVPCANALIVVDRFANVHRVEEIIKTLDVGAPVKPLSCSDRPE